MNSKSPCSFTVQDDIKNAIDVAVTKNNFFIVCHVFEFSANIRQKRNIGKNAPAGEARALCGRGGSEQRGCGVEASLADGVEVFLGFLLGCFGSLDTLDGLVDGLQGFDLGLVLLDATAQRPGEVGV